MSACHCKDDGVTVDSHYVPRARQSLRLWRLVPVFIKTLLPSSNHSQYFLGRNVDLANRMILCVADVYEVLVLTENVAEALRMMELRLIIVSIDKADLTVSYLLIKLHCLLIHQDNTIIGSVRDHDQVMIQASLLLDTDHFARVSEVLPSSTSLFATLTHGLIFKLGPLKIRFLLLRLPLNRTRVL